MIQIRLNQTSTMQSTHSFSMNSDLTFFLIRRISSCGRNWRWSETWVLMPILCWRFWHRRSLLSHRWRTHSSSKKTGYQTIKLSINNIIIFSPLPSYFSVHIMLAGMSDMCKKSGNWFSVSYHNATWKSSKYILFHSFITFFSFFYYNYKYELIFLCCCFLDLMLLHSKKEEVT